MAKARIVYVVDDKELKALDKELKDEQPLDFIEVDTGKVVKAIEKIDKALEGKPIDNCFRN